MTKSTDGAPAAAASPLMTPERWRAVDEILQAALAYGPERRAIVVAEAHKRLAFIQCAASQLAGCELEFRLARQADPAFALDRSEAGHPVWGPIYRKVVPP